MNYELVGVMPVYNEAPCLQKVLKAWLQEWMRLGIHCHMIVVNDGSRDETAALLHAWAADSRLTIIQHASNRGHGPSILEGYRRAVSMAEWVFQTDSDDEISPIHFVELWRRRHDYDALLGVRTGRRQSLVRHFISAMSRVSVGLLFGNRVKDVNVPYRLVRSDHLARIMRFMEPDLFAPNVIMSGMLSVMHDRVFNWDVPCYWCEMNGAGMSFAKSCRAACVSFRQLIRHRINLITSRRRVS